MNDQLISFETAKLAKEKGFDHEVYGEHLYINQNRWFFSEGEECFYGFMEDVDEEGFYKNQVKHLIPRPSQSLLQRWLREKHNKHCLADCNAVGWAWFIEKTNGTHIASGDYEGPIPESGRWSTYEAALEAGLIEALKLL